jgi:hypothetical protein
MLAKGPKGSIIQCLDKSLNTPIGSSRTMGVFKLLSRHCSHTAQWLTGAHQVLVVNGISDRGERERFRRTIVTTTPSAAKGCVTAPYPALYILHFSTSAHGGTCHVDTSHCLFQRQSMASCSTFLRRLLRHGWATERFGGHLPLIFPSSPVLVDDSARPHVPGRAGSGNNFTLSFAAQARNSLLFVAQPSMLCRLVIDSVCKRQFCAWHRDQAKLSLSRLILSGSRLLHCPNPASPGCAWSPPSLHTVYRTWIIGASSPSTDYLCFWAVLWQKSGLPSTISRGTSLGRRLRFILS